MRVNTKVFNEFPALETDRLKLREVEDKDFKEIFEIYKDKEAIKFQGIPPFRNINEAIRSVMFIQRGFRNRIFIRWAIAFKECDEIIGFISLHNMNLREGKAEIGIMLNRKYWGKGIMSEAFGRVIQFAFKEFGLYRIKASIHPDNIASIKICEKYGFRLQNLKRNCVFNGRTHKYEDRLIYTLTNSK